MLTIPPVDIDPNSQDMIFIFLVRNLSYAFESHMCSLILTHDLKGCVQVSEGPNYYPLCVSLYAFGLDLQAQAKMR
jgi:hypothetical protein